MAKRTVELDDERQETEGQRALREAEERAERAEAELERLRRAQGLHDAVAGETHGHAGARSSKHKDAEERPAKAHARADGDEAETEQKAAHRAGSVAGDQPAHTAKQGGAKHATRGHAEELEGDLFAAAEPAAGGDSERKDTRKREDDDETPARHAQRMVARTIEEERHGTARDKDGDEPEQEDAKVHRGRSTARHGRVDPENDPGNAGEVKEPPTRSSAEGEPEMEGGEEELRKDSMMAHLLDSLEAGKDIGHYGRLVFAMVSRHFLPHEEVLAWMTKDRDFGEEEAELMLRQVEGRDYSPPRRAKILEYQREQEFPILPHPHDPDCGNLYRNLKFPDAVYKHIGHYQEQKMEAEDE